MKKLFITLLTMLSLLWGMESVAQTLVFHLTDGTSADVELYSAFRMLTVSDKLIVSLPDGSMKEFSQNDILTVTYQETKGDVNRDSKVDVADIATVIRIMAGAQTITVITGSATAITQNSASIAGTVSGVSSQVTVGILYGINNSLDSSSPKVTTTSSGNFTVNLTGLTPNTIYYYRAFAEIDGKYYYGGIKLFTTLSTTGVLNGHEWVDLGLPSGTKWATCNVGASSPEDFGCHYAWGETSEKTYYSWAAYQYGNSTNDVMNIGSDISGTNYDVACLKWGNPWRMPSLNQIKELLNCCSKQWTRLNNVKGYRLVGPNGSSIFLPAAGYCESSIHGGKGDLGKYWSSSVNDMTPRYAYSMYFGSADISWAGNNSARYYGLSIRPVCNN